MKTTELITSRREHKNPKKIPSMEQYMRSKFQFLGIQAVQRRELSKEFLKTKRAETKARVQDKAMKTRRLIGQWSLTFLNYPNANFN